MRTKRRKIALNIGAGAGVVGGVIVARYAAAKLRRHQSTRARHLPARNPFGRHPSLRTWHGMAMAIEPDQGAFAAAVT